MAATNTYERAWQAYQQAVEELYASSWRATKTTERGVGTITATGQFAEASDTLLIRSAQLREVLMLHLETENRPQAELAALKLVAAAGYDLSLASDLLEAEDASAVDERERGARQSMMAPVLVRQIMGMPIEVGMTGLQEIERAAFSNEPMAARTQLEATISTFLAEVPQQAAIVSQMAVAGVIDLGGTPAQGTVSLAVQEILTYIPSGISLLVRRAAALVLEAINKLWSAISPQQGSQSRQQIMQWLDQFEQQRNLVVGLLNRLYETQRIGQETTKMVEAASSGTTAAQYNQATQALETLLGGYDKTKGALEWVLRILALIKTPLLGAAPWGPLAAYATYLGVLGYAVYSGGDYLDWYRTGNIAWLKRVQGLRTTVEQALSSSK